MSESSSRKGNPISWDWRTKLNNTNPIKDQEDANNCYAHAICGVLENALCIEKKLENVLLSPRDIYTGMIKVDKQYETAGCSIADAIKWAKSNGCVLESSCRYVRPFNKIENDRKVYLRFDTTEEIDLTTDLAFKKEKDKSKGKILESRIVMAPVAAQMIWIDEMNYLTGDAIYSGPKSAKAFEKKDPKDDDEYHAVMIVGYGQEMKKNNLIKYWIIQNSHGKEWGNGGFAKINRAPCHGKLLIDYAFVIKGVKIFESE